MDLTGRRIAAYARYSTDRQSTTSVADQVAKLSRWVEMHGGVIATSLTFADEAVSGAVRERPGLMALVEAVEQGRVDLLVVEDLGRLSRDTEDSAWLRKRLVHYGVRLVCIDDGIDTASDGAELMGDVMAGFKALYRREVAKKTTRGMEAKARAGMSTGGLPYGYRSVPCDGGQRIEIVPERAEVVRGIFLAFAEGDSYRTIAERLNEEGVSPPRGSRSAADPSWQTTTVRSILRNPRYAGTWTFGRLQWLRDPDTRRRISRTRPEALVSEVRAELAIVDASVFERVASRLAETAARYAGQASREQPRRKYLLSGLLVCGECGAPMSIHGGTVDRRYYRCSAAGTRGTCANRLTVQEGIVRDRFLTALRDRLLAPEAQEEIRRAVDAALAARNAGQGRERQALVERIRANRTRAARLVEAIADGGAPQALLAAIQTAEAQVRADEAALDSLGAEEAGPSTASKRGPSTASIAEAVTSLRALAEDIPRGRETLRRWLEGGSIRMVPRQGSYIARASVLPLMLMGRRFDSVDCGGRI